MIIFPFHRYRPPYGMAHAYAPMYAPYAQPMMAPAGRARPGFGRGGR